jgi:hypothetical protein
MTRRSAQTEVRHRPGAAAAGLYINPGWSYYHLTRERYPYRFAGKAVTAERVALPGGDFGMTLDGEVVAMVERKTLEDLATSLSDGKLAFQLQRLSEVPAAAVAIEGRYSALLKTAPFPGRVAGRRARPTSGPLPEVADGLRRLSKIRRGLDLSFPGVGTRRCIEEDEARGRGGRRTRPASSSSAPDRVELPRSPTGTAPSEVTNPPGSTFARPTTAPPTRRGRASDKKDV